VKAEARPLRGADALARNDAEHQRASGQAISVDDDTFARRAHRCECFKIATDLTAAVL